MTAPSSGTLQPADGKPVIVRVQEWEGIAKLKICVLWVASSILDSTFLGLWALIQWLTARMVFDNIHLTGLDHLVLVAFQVLFAVSTLLPVVIYIFADIAKMGIRAWKAITHELSQP